MGVSRYLIETISNSLKAHLNDASVLIERYRQSPIDLEARQDIKRARIAIYEIEERVVAKVDNYRSFDSVVRYGVDVSVLRPYVNDDGSRGELPTLDLRDQIVDWVNSVDITSLTNSYLFSLTYNSSTSIVRGDRYVTLTMTLEARKNSELEQSTNP